MEERHCIECHTSYGIESHHVIFRSQAKYLEKCDLIQVDLCNIHHRGNDGPHRDKKKDLQYKQELQLKLGTLFVKEYYSVSEIKEVLNITDNAVKKLVKLIHVNKEGYGKEDIILRIMGRNYL